jgi:CspA family cold shock protein
MGCGTEIVSEWSSFDDFPRHRGISGPNMEPVSPFRTLRLGGPSCDRSSTMSLGTIKRLTDRGFGFISNESGTDMFFHMSAVEGVRFEELREGQKVSYNEGRGPKGPRAENVRVL